MRRPLTVPTSGTVANAEDYGDNPTPLAVWVTPDGVVLGGPGAWQQLAALVPQAYAANWAVPDWYIDGVVGLDTNNGTTALTPLRTGAELLRRLGPYALWGQSVTVHVLANGMTDALILRGAMMVAGTHLDAVGTPTVLLSDTVATYAAANHALATGNQITAIVLANFAPYQWARCRITGGARAGTVWWIATSNPAGAGANVARVTRPVNIDPASTSDMYTNVVPVAGDPFDIEALPTVPALIMQVDGPTNQAAGSQYAQRQFAITGLALPSFTLMATGTTERVKGSIFAVKLANWNQNTPQPSGLSVTTLRGCSVYGVDPAQGGFFRNCGQFFNCLFGQGLTSIAFTQITYCADGLFQNCAPGGIAYLQILNSQIFDVVGATSTAFAPTLGVSNNISGTGNAGYGFAVGNNTTWRALGTTNLQGVVSNGRLTAAPATSLTLPQLLQPSDYAQKGTVQLPGGANNWVDVVVPWWDPTIQRLTLGIKDLNAVGAIQVYGPSANRTNTGFRIQCGNATNTSTVDWQISVLGRNIFISTT